MAGSTASRTRWVDTGERTGERSAERSAFREIIDSKMNQRELGVGHWRSARVDAQWTEKNGKQLAKFKSLS